MKIPKYDPLFALDTQWVKHDAGGKSKVKYWSLKNNPIAEIEYEEYDAPIYNVYSYCIPVKGFKTLKEAQDYIIEGWKNYKEPPTVVSKKCRTGKQGKRFYY